MEVQHLQGVVSFREESILTSKQIIAPASTWPWFLCWHLSHPSSHLCSVPTRSCVSPGQGAPLLSTALSTSPGCCFFISDTNTHCWPLPTASSDEVFILLLWKGSKMFLQQGLRSAAPFCTSIPVSSNYTISPLSLSLSLSVLCHYSSKKSCYTQEPAVNAKERLLPVLFSDSSCLVHLKSSRGHPGDSNAYTQCCSLNMGSLLLPFLFLPTGIVHHWGRLFLKGSFNVRLEKHKLSI